uniref:Uncharacterized protein n=1 Tax=Elaeophora elaphi TaxID=1147741 RepID=A0A0R3S4Q5_9BILA
MITMLCSVAWKIAARQMRKNSINCSSRSVDYHGSNKIRRDYLRGYLLLITVIDGIKCIIGSGKMSLLPMRSLSGSLPVLFIEARLQGPPEIIFSQMGISFDADKCNIALLNSHKRHSSTFGFKF